LEVFLSPCVFWVASFLSEVVLSQRVRGLIVRLHSWLHFLSLIAFVKYRASVASDFDVSNFIFWGIEAYIAASGYIGSASLKTSHPHGLFL
jgi:hypothetical protein